MVVDKTLCERISQLVFEATQFVAQLSHLSSRTKPLGGYLGVIDNGWIRYFAPHGTITKEDSCKQMADSLTGLQLLWSATRRLVF